MIFAPFTGKDNHGKIVTFGGALISGEDKKMHSWVFERFKECMQRSPMLFITDQYPAMKIALEAVFPETTHRLCMWHIMMKVPDKTPSHLKKNDEFRKQLNELVWSDMIVASEFERRWNDLMSEFGLIGDKWFDGIYDIRQYWISAFFRDIPMSGVCRTTSISESVNAFLDHFLSYGSNLIEFLMHYESSMDSQRQTNDRLNSLEKTIRFIWKSPLAIERHAATIYTKNLFVKVQEEIEVAIVSCKSKGMVQHLANTTYEIDDGFNGLVRVTHDKEREYVECNCNKFVRDGLLCSHIFWVFKDLDISMIPEKYIVHRWTKTAYENPLFENGNMLLATPVLFDDKKRKTNKMISDLFACIGVVEGDDEKFQSLVDVISRLRDALVPSNGELTPSNMNNKLFEIFYGMDKPVAVDVHDPPGED